jgi:hypothetical protein
MRVLFAILFLLTVGCSAEPTEPKVLADSAFSGTALLDANGNGQIDPEDTPIEGATFSVEIDGVKVFREITDEKGYAYILIPGGVEYPVNVIMEVPEDSSLKPITPSTVSVSTGISATQFLFSSETK